MSYIILYIIQETKHRFTINQVTFVGMVNEITEASTSITYKIDDYTGPVMSVRKFIQEGEVNLWPFLFEI